LKALGAVPIRGDLSTFDTLEQESAKADVVLHCAFIHDFVGGKISYDEVIRADCDAVNAIAKGLKGSGKPLIVSSGSGGKVPDPNGGEVDETAPVDEDFPLKARMASEQYAMDKTKDGIRVSLIRIAPFVYGRGGSVFIPWLIAKAHAAGESLYIGDGSSRMTTLHVDAAATLYLAVAKHATGGIFNGSGSTTVTAKEIAEAVGTLLNVPVRSVTKEEAVKDESLGPILTLFMGTECRSSNKKAREELGWKPTGIDLPTDVAQGSYKESAAKLAQKA
jgi:nucleoside-diphosphate-sugar epimerase